MVLPTSPPAPLSISQIFTEFQIAIGTQKLLSNDLFPLVGGTAGATCSLGASFSGQSSQGLYSFTDATFTPGGVTGRYGPSISQARAGLTGTPAPSNWYNTRLDMVTQGYQLWTVPQTATYTITAAGGAGYSPSSGGYGAILSGTFSLTQGEVLTILVGQAANGEAGGGGGTFVVRSPYGIGNSLIVAGGGGGKYSTAGGGPSLPAQSGTSGACAGQCGTVSGGGGSNGGGGGGGSAGGGSGGGGFLGDGGYGTGGVYCCGGGAGGNGTNGTNSNCGSNGGQNTVGRSYVNGGVGGVKQDGAAAGGFGGGGGWYEWNLGAGGGGGYSGGGGGGTNTGNAGCSGGVHEGGGGGGSINNGSNPSFSATNSATGYVTITKGVPSSNFVAVANGGTGALGLRSSDGINWISVTIPGTYYASVIYNTVLQKYAAVGNNVVLSSDGINWTSPAGTPAGFAIGFSPVSGRFVVVQAGSSTAYYSDNGTTWSSSSLPASRTWNGVTAKANGVFVASAQGTDRGAYSYDGRNWAETVMPSSTQWQFVTYTPVNNRFVIVPNSSAARTYSNDGISWSSGSGGTSGNWNPCACSTLTGRLIAVEYGSTSITYSDDGINWTTSAVLPVSAQWQGITHSTRVGSVNYGRFITFGRDGKFAYSDNNGANWTAGSDLPAGNTWFSAAAYSAVPALPSPTTPPATGSWTISGYGGSTYYPRTDNWSLTGLTAVAGGQLQYTATMSGWSPFYMIFNPNGDYTYAYGSQYAQGGENAPTQAWTWAQVLAAGTGENHTWGLTCIRTA